MVENVELCGYKTRLTKGLNLSSKKIESTIQSYHYTGERREKDQKVENLRMPSMALAFYTYVFEKETIPTQDELIETYLSHGAFQILANGMVSVSFDGTTTTVTKSGLEARILRTYPSIIRDIHFYYLVLESGLFESVHYSFINDFYYMIDLKVLYNGHWFNIGMLFDSYRAEQFRQKKQTRHEVKEDVIYIKLSRDSCKQCGSFYLYTNNHVNQLYQEITQK